MFQHVCLSLCYARIKLAYFITQVINENIDHNQIPETFLKIHLKISFSVGSKLIMTTVVQSYAIVTFHVSHLLLLLSFSTLFFTLSFLTLPGFFRERKYCLLCTLAISKDNKYRQCYAAFQNVHLSSMTDIQTRLYSNLLFSSS